MNIRVGFALLAAAVLSACVDIAAEKGLAVQEGVDHCAIEGRLWISGSVEVKGNDVVVSGGCAYVYRREDIERFASAMPGRVTHDYSDYVQIESHDGLTQYYLTKPNHPIYPWAFSFRLSLDPDNQKLPPRIADWSTAIPANFRVPTDAQSAKPVEEWVERFSCEAVSRCMSAKK